MIVPAVRPPVTFPFLLAVAALLLLGACKNAADPGPGPVDHINPIVKRYTYPKDTAFNSSSDLVVEGVYGDGSKMDIDPSTYEVTIPGTDDALVFYQLGTYTVKITYAAAEGIILRAEYKVQAVYDPNGEIDPESPITAGTGIQIVWATDTDTEPTPGGDPDDDPDPDDSGDPDPDPDPDPDD
jgi:hypothetical protein